MSWLKSDGPVIVSIPTDWPDRHWDLSDAEYRRASGAEIHRLGSAARARRAVAREKQAVANRHHRVLRRARDRGASGSHTALQWMALVVAHAGCCAYCGATGVPLTRDHVQPLSLGGSNDITNILPACFSCNSRKGAR